MMFVQCIMHTLHVYYTCIYLYPGLMSTQDGAFEGVVKYDLLAKTVVEVYKYIFTCYMLYSIFYIYCTHTYITNIIIS